MRAGLLSSLLAQHEPRTIYRDSLEGKWKASLDQQAGPLAGWLYEGRPVVLIASPAQKPHYIYRAREAGMWPASSAAGQHASRPSVTLRRGYCVS